MSVNTDTVFKFLLPVKVMSSDKSKDEFSEETERMLHTGLNQLFNSISSNSERNLLPLSESITDLIKQTDMDNVYNFASAFQSTLETRKGIGNFESPENYKAEEVVIDDEAVEQSLKTLETFQEELEIRDKEYSERVERAITAYEIGDIPLSIFLFTSIQDAVMRAICEEEGYEKGDFPSFKQKKKTVEEVFDSVWGLESSDFREKLDAYLKHRHYIMHGNPDAVFDEKIAKISMIFLVLTLLHLQDRNYYKHF
jgi:hypothetical protein